MTVYFFDSSALVKRYVAEIGSIWVESLFHPSLKNNVFIAAITAVEITAAISRRARGGNISPTDAKAVYSQLKNDLQSEYQVIEITDNIINSAMTLTEKHGLRGYDAVQLAAAQAINNLCIANNLHPLTFISADQELNNAAVHEGLVVDNPNNHP
ncbi:type II toxin-antitoxin system VapC family toxin [Sphaerospermopsis aphanizomenoides BCCUSP55]|uniref:type II toxin-antitoxin system VapC family toxin n=1 Tax=Sphaerospermopsis aphanizomenoides TaxID=459663 RepID=UPI001907376C|nr:type II toxin-antitoxin system VapC family toxin [Sphaerospermopsis aphanizomenoides]MBK1988109.1 type II toxin-antitoxin system VapC family toxin [Sphaerospermopsis aphanizomenoides BCCUSP55]